MNRIVDFFKKKVNLIKMGKLPVPEDSPQVNMTGILSNPQNILIIPYNRMGTILLATRVFKTIRDRFPSAKITIAVHNAWSVLIQNDPAIDEVVTFEDEIENPFSPKFLSIGDTLASRKYDLAFFLSFQFDQNLAYLTRLSNASLRVAFLKDQEYSFFNVEIVPEEGNRYEVERYLELLHTLGIPGTFRDYTMTISPAIREKVRLRYFPGGYDPLKNIILGFDLTKETVGETITRKNAESVIKVLVNELDATLIVFYEQGKRHIASALKDVFGKRIILIDDRQVSTVAGLLSFCAFVVTYNTDLFQLVVALKIPVMSILTKKEMVQWSPGESDLIVHIERSAMAWPSSAIISQTAKNLLKQKKN
jgi:ADP-heptose:LPS heptosyltransferase